MSQTELNDPQFPVHDPGVIERAVRWALSVDVPEAKAYVAWMRARQPGAEPADLASQVFGRESWKAAALGASTGLPGGLALAIPAALADAGGVLRIEVAAAARVALLYEPDFFDDPDAAWDLLIPIFGVDIASQALREVGVQGAIQAASVGLAKLLTKRAFTAFQVKMLKVFGWRVTRKAVFTKTLPLVGGAVGGTWNLIEVRLLGRRLVRHFEQRAAAQKLAAATTN